METSTNNYESRIFRNLKSPPNSTYGLGNKNAGICADSMWRILEELFESYERSKLRFE
ncbi:hypothetical protein Glove_94g23 [Diversispora epigaea]|uniref:Uncharacterized protein n=1 Tax=Diversispora epigaea TaxID=1348612 RepID=A0A397JFL1_9GLOM|nr:hypothetical protein Glove_94g23 [Diversispora epigaea]